MYLFSLNANKHFRIETEFVGLLASQGNHDYYFRLGLMGMWQRGKTNFYSRLKGARITDVDIAIFTPTIRAEYVF